MTTRQQLFAQSIRTAFHGPTTHRGDRIKASASGGRSHTQAWDYGLSVEANHMAAAQALAVKLEWEGEWVGGALGDGGYVLVRRDTCGPAFVVEGKN